MTDETTSNETEKDWLKDHVLIIEVGNENGFDFFKARGDALAFSQIKPSGRDWELMADDDYDVAGDDIIIWRRKEAEREDLDYWKRR